MRLSILLLASLAACSTASGPPAWAIDPIWIDGAANDGMQGFQTWQLYGPGWDNGYGERHYLCAVVVRLDGTPIECDACNAAWSIETRLVETDCPDLELDRFLTLEGLELSAPGSAAGPQAPQPTQSALVRADYGSGWEPYGWAWPAALDEGRASTSGGVFDGSEPFQLQPTLLWDLTQ